jgi:DNA-binding MarR family transcriptional regulator
MIYAERQPNETNAPVFYRAEAYKTQVSVGYLMRRVVSLMTHEIDKRMEPHGLTNAQWLPLIKLHYGQAESVAELARTCELDTGAMTRLLDRVEGKGLCRRVRSFEDRRVVNLELTAEGEAAAQVIPGVLSELQNQLLEGFTVVEWEQLQALLLRVLDNALRMQVQTTDENSKGKR